MIEGRWYDAEVEAFPKKGPYDYIVFYKADGKEWESKVKQAELRARP